MRSRILRVMTTQLLTARWIRLIVLRLSLLKMLLVTLRKTVRLVRLYLKIRTVIVWRPVRLIRVWVLSRRIRCVLLSGLIGVRNRVTVWWTVRVQVRLLLSTRCRFTTVTRLHGVCLGKVACLVPCRCRCSEARNRRYVPYVINVARRVIRGCGSLSN